MPILNMVGGGKKGGNIGEPLNLTVTSSGLDATITWEDNEIGTIPPTTFQKSELVRKVGSAPTSPSDGTLVVTETVKDTYKVSGYTDSGLTDGTTYYYRVFSYSDLGGISYCDAVSVTPSGGWQPGVNTLAYYPLTSVSTISDLSGNNYTLSNDGNTQFGTYAGVDCAYINFTGRTALSNSTLGGQIGLNTPFTYSTWVNSMYVNSERGILSCCKPGTWEEDRAIGIMGDAKIRFYINDGGAKFAYTPSISANTWYYVVGTFDGTNMKVYLNAVLSETTASGYSGGLSSTTFAIGTKHPSQSNAFEGYVSNVIVEDVVWTSQEVTNYFNATKGDYGIS